jgi:hypothetical protein
MKNQCSAFIKNVKIFEMEYVAIFIKNVFDDELYFDIEYLFLLYKAFHLSDKRTWLVEADKWEYLLQEINKTINEHINKKNE